VAPNRAERGRGPARGRRRSAGLTAATRGGGRPDGGLEAEAEAAVELEGRRGCRAGCLTTARPTRGRPHPVERIERRARPRPLPLVGGIVPASRWRCRVALTGADRYAPESRLAARDAEPGSRGASMASCRPAQSSRQNGSNSDRVDRGGLAPRSPSDPSAGRPAGPLGQVGEVVASRWRPRALRTRRRGTAAAPGAARAPVMTVVYPGRPAGRGSAG